MEANHSKPRAKKTSDSFYQRSNIEECDLSYFIQPEKDAF